MWSVFNTKHMPEGTYKISGGSWHHTVCWEFNCINYIDKGQSLRELVLCYLIQAGFIHPEDRKMWSRVCAPGGMGGKGGRELLTGWLPEYAGGQRKDRGDWGARGHVRWHLGVRPGPQEDTEGTSEVLRSAGYRLQVK